MASIETLKDASGNTRGWKVRYRDDEQNERAKTFLVKRGEGYKDATTFASTTEASKATGRYVDDRLGRQTVAHYARGWVRDQGSTKRLVSMFSNHLYELPLGRQEMMAVRYSNVAGWLASREKVLSPRTVRGLVGYLKRMFSDAVKDRVIGESPCHDIKGPTVSSEPVEAMSVSELEAIRDALPLRWRDIVRVGRRCGLRPSELRGLTVDRVDFLRRTVKVDRQLLPGGFAPPKYRSYRTVIVDQECVDLIAAHLARWGEGPDRLVFTNSRGEPMSYSCLNDAWDRAVKAAQARHCTPHAMRHHYASVLIGAGVDLATVAQQLGHQNAHITASVYTHVVKGQDERRRQVIETALQSRVLDVSWGNGLVAK